MNHVGVCRGGNVHYVQHKYNCHKKIVQCSCPLSTGDTFLLLPQILETADSSKTPSCSWLTSLLANTRAELLKLGALSGVHAIHLSGKQTFGSPWAPCKVPFNWDRDASTCSQHSPNWSSSLYLNLFFIIKKMLVMSITTNCMKQLGNRLFCLPVVVSAVRLLDLCS